MLSAKSNADYNPSKGDFFEYWDSLGFFENIKSILPPNFFVLFEIARTIFSEEVTSEAYDAIEEMTKEETVFKPDRDESIQVNRLDKIAPVGDRMEIDTFKKMEELKKALPRELAMDDEIFDVKLFTKSMIVRKFYESEADSFKPISTSRDQKGKDANRFEQKFYILLDRSKSMEANMRTFYSKCIVAEFLRRKMNTNAKLYYRSFDSKARTLFKIEKPEDFGKLIEEVLLTTTGGRSTNIEAAVYQAIRDIRYDKEMLKSEIMIITDGISKINRNKLKIDLGDIKLNVLKIGDEIPEPDFYDIESGLANEKLNFDPNAINIRDIQKKVMENKDSMDEGRMSITEKRIYRYIFDFSNKMFKDLKDVSHKYIEISDLDPSNLYTVTDETLDYIQNAIKKFNEIDPESLEYDDKMRLYKQVHFMGQYIQMYIQNGNQNNKQLQQFADDVHALREKLIKDPDILMTFIQVKELQEDKELTKLAKKEARALMKQMKLTSKKLSMEEMKQGQLLFTGDVGGEGNMGQFILLMLIKFGQFIKRVVGAPFKKSSKKEEDDNADTESNSPAA